MVVGRCPIHLKFALKVRCVFAFACIRTVLEALCFWIVHACVSLSVCVFRSLWTQYLINCLWEFHQIYNCVAIGGKYKLIKWRSTCQRSSWWPDHISTKNLLLSFFCRHRTLNEDSFDLTRMLWVVLHFWTKYGQGQWLNMVKKDGSLCIQGCSSNWSTLDLELCVGSGAVIKFKVKVIVFIKSI